MSATRSRLAALLALTLATGVLAACGSSDGKSGSSTGGSSASSTGAVSGASSAASSGDAAGSTGDSSSTVSTEPLPGSDKEVPADAVALVGDDTITIVKFDGLFETAIAQQQVDGGQEPPKAGSLAEDTLKQQVLEYLVRDSELAQEARKAGLTADAAKVDEQIKSAKESCCQGKDADWKKYLEERKLTEEQVRASFESQEISQQLYDRITKDVKATEEQLKERYEQDKATAYTDPRSRKVVYALFGEPGKAPTAKDKERAEKFIADVKAGGDFQKLAVKRTDDESASSTNAELDVTDEGYDADFVKAAFDLKTGEYTLTPVKSDQFGYFVILAKEDTKEASVKPYEDVKAEIQTTLDQELKQAAADTWFAEMQRRFQPLIALAAGYSFPEGSLFAPKGLARAATGTEETTSTATDTAPAGDSATVAADESAASSADATADTGTTTG